MKNKKIAFVGNLGNCTYWYVKHLRELKIDACLYITFKKYDKEGKPIIPFKQDPREEDSDLKGVFPSWIKFFHLYSIKNIFLNFKKEFKQYHLIFAFEATPIFLQFCQKPLISFGTGSNLREQIFERGIKAFLLRRGFLKSRMVLFDNIDNRTLISLKKLRIKKYEWLPDYYSKDTLLKSMENSEIKDDFLKKFKERLICFSPSRIDFEQKGTDILIKGFAAFNNENLGTARLLIINWGKDKDKAKELIRNLGIGNKVTFLPVLSYPDVLKLINDCSVTFGYFCNGNSGIHHFPLCLQEALTFGKISISSLDQDAFLKIVGEKPKILESFSEEDIKNQLNLVFKNYFDLEKEFSKEAPYWIKKYCSKEFIRSKLVKIIEEHVQQ